MLLLAHSAVAFVLLHHLLLLLSHAPFITHSGNIPTVPCLCWRSLRHADSSIRCYHRSTDSTRSSLWCPLFAVSYDLWIFVCSYVRNDSSPSPRSSSYPDTATMDIEFLFFIYHELRMERQLHCPLLDSLSLTVDLHAMLQIIKHPVIDSHGVFVATGEHLLKQS